MTKYEHSFEIARSLQEISYELSETNRLLREFLQYTLRHEGDSWKESAEK